MMNRRQSRNPHSFDPEFDAAFFPLLITLVFLATGAILGLLWLLGWA
jgi:hypothetical protein